MEEAEFFPSDYDGIHAGSPGLDYSHLMESFIWSALLTARNPAATLDTAAQTLLNTDVLRTCGGQQAVQSGYLLDPRTCVYDPAKLACTNGPSPGTCLTTQQVAEAKRLYSPVTDTRTGQQLYPGFAKGSESQWTYVQNDLVPSFAQPLLANTVYGDPNWDWTSFDFDKDAARVDKMLSPVINATSPDLRSFRAHGGKLLMTQGWADALNAQSLPIQYFNSVVAGDGSLGEVQSYFRLYMAPGMSHCGGGPGPNTIGGAVPPMAYTPDRDSVSALEAWVENDTPPQALISTKYLDDKPPTVSREQKLCPYPSVARPVGGGDPTQASSYACLPDKEQALIDYGEEVGRLSIDAQRNTPANRPN